MNGVDSWGVSKRWNSGTPFVSLTSGDCCARAMALVILASALWHKGQQCASFQKMYQRLNSGTTLDISSVLCILLGNNRLLLPVAFSRLRARWAYWALQRSLVVAGLQTDTVVEDMLPLEKE